MGPMLWWLLSAALAHPFGAKFAAHLSIVEVSPHEVRVTYMADVPNPLVASSTRVRGADPIEAMAEELRTGLVLEIDDQTVPLTPLQGFDVQPTEDTHRFTWRLTAPVDDLPRSIELSNGNLPGVAAVYRSRVEVADGLQITASSLWRMRGDELALDETDLWRTDERHRTLTTTIDLQPSPWPRRLGAIAALVMLVGLSATVARQARLRRPRAR